MPNLQNPQVVSFKFKIADILLSEKYMAISRFKVDLFFYVIADDSENELIYLSISDTLFEAMDTLFGQQLEKRTLLENFDLLILCVDEITEEGFILENDSSNIVQKVSSHGDSDPKKKDLVGQIYQSVTEQFKNSLFSFNNN